MCSCRILLNREVSFRFSLLTKVVTRIGRSGCIGISGGKAWSVRPLVMYLARVIRFSSPPRCFSSGVQLKEEQPPGVKDRRMSRAK